MRFLVNRHQRSFSRAEKIRLDRSSHAQLGVRLIQIASLVCLLTSVSTAESFDIITRRTVSPGVEVIRIDKPNPTKRATDYPQITFQPGDLITIRAGGCVQSGGIGN